MELPVYKFQCRDHSRLTPYLRRFLSATLIKVVPAWLTANAITIISNLFLYWALGIALQHGTSDRLDFLTVPTLILAYLVGDHLDGLQARKTATGSPLGEFFDHYLDAFNNGIFLMCLFLLFQIHPLLIAFFLFISYLTHLSVFYEQYHTGWLIFEKFGQFESVVLLILVMFLGWFGPIQELSGTKVWNNLTVLEAFFLISTPGAIATLLKCFRRTKKVTLKLGVQVMTLGLISWLSSSLFSPEIMFGVITLYGGLIVGSYIRAHLLGLQDRFPDPITPFALIVGYAFQPVEVNELSFLIILYLVIRVLVQSYQIFVPLKGHWAWYNSRQIVQPRA